ncbi:MAG: sigma-70 family RNA polymerase sigma factor [Chloroflexota bacterium]|nr:MAG: sigma-70 family RNA polymerase sigma factor [Chloroflexota bacterium]
MDVAQDIVGTVVGESADHVARRVTDHYERRGRELWGLARRLGASDEQAADVVQEVHLRLWRELTSGTFIEDIDAWVFRVAYRLVMDQHRLGRRVRELVGRLTAGNVESVSHALDDRLSLWPLVDRLPARERATLYLRYRADLSFEQIGEVMGITTASARTYASRGVERLRSTVGELGGDER